MVTKSDGNFLLFGIAMGVLGNLLVSSMFSIGETMHPGGLKEGLNWVLFILSLVGFFIAYGLAKREIMKLPD